MATMKQFVPLVNRARRCQYNIKFKSQPALGKDTALDFLVAEIRAKENPDFGHIVWDGGTLQPTDTVMAMPNMLEGVIKKMYDGEIPNAYDNPDSCGIIRVGEMGLMGIEASKGLQKLWNHEDIGGRMRIPNGWIFVGLSNRTKDKSGVASESRANMSRFESHDLVYEPLYNREVMKRYHPLIGAFALADSNLGYLDNYADIFENDERKPDDLFLREGKEDGIWANLRSWKRVSDKLFDVEATGIPLMDGEITRNLGSQITPIFEAHRKMIDSLTTLEDIQAHPDTAPVPKRMDEQFALSSMLALLVRGNNFDAVATFMRRGFYKDLQIVFFRLMNDRLKKNPKGSDAVAIRSSKVYQKWITEPEIYKLITGTSEE